MNVFWAFHQTYQPVLGSIFLSAIVAGLPLYVLFVMLAVLRLPAWMCAVASMLTAALLGWIVWGMPLGVTFGAATEGMAFGLWPISWIVLNAVFFHNLTVASGDFDVIKRALARLTVDRRLQALLVAFSFGALIEGIAGFGAPVAISASILASLGFEPVTAAVLALLANTAPVAFGSIGIPVVTLGRLVAPVLGHTDPTSTTMALSAMVGRQLPLFSIIIPAYLIVVLAGWRRMREVLPAVLVTGVSFAVVQFLVSNLVGPELTDIIAALVSMGCLAALLRFWRPREIWQFAHESAVTTPTAQPRRVMGGSDLPARGVAMSRSPLDIADPPSRIARAFSMYIVLVLVILIGQMGNLPWWSGHPVGDVKTSLAAPANITADFKCGNPGFKLCPLPWIGPDPAKDRHAFTVPYWSFYWPGTYTLDKKGQPVSVVLSEKPIVAKEAPYNNPFNWDFLAAAGTLVLFASIVAFIVMRLAGARLNIFTVYARTVRQLALPIVTISFILGIAYVMNFSGMTSSLAIAFSKTGLLFPFVSAFLRWLRLFLAGCDIFSNTLFLALPAQNAQQPVQVRSSITAGS